MHTLIGVIGPSSPNQEEKKVAYEVGKLIAQEGWVLINGGLAGTMTEAARGAKEKAGLTVGILPQADKAEANPYVDIAIPTGMGWMRNYLIVQAADAIISIGVSPGTLNEMTVAIMLNKFMVSLLTKEPILPGLRPVSGPEEAIAEIKKFLSGGKSL